MFMMAFELDRGQTAEAGLVAVVDSLDPDQDRDPKVLEGGRFRTFFCSRLKNDSIAALSPHEATLVRDGGHTPPMGRRVHSGSSCPFADPREEPHLCRSDCSV